MGYFNAINISASGLTAQRLRLDTIAQNISNVNTTGNAQKLPYRRKMTVFQERSSDFYDILANRMNEDAILNGVRVTNIVEDESPFRMVYEPGNPDADENGYVWYPNVDLMTEMVNMISATRSYEANVTVLNSSKSLAMKALEIGR